MDNKISEQKEVAEPQALSNDKTDGSSSMAKNYFNPLSAQVDPRTGSLGLGIMPPPLKGILSMDVNLGITYNQSDTFSGTSLFGLPPGWSYPLSYILGAEISINGTQSYVLDEDNASGLQFYYQTNLVLQDLGNAPQPLPYDSDQDYNYLLSFLDGHHQYFDSKGRLICYDDKNGNHQLFYYDVEGKDISESILTGVTATSGMPVAIAKTGTSIQITYPQEGANDIQFSYVGNETYSELKEYIDPIGESTIIKYDGGVVRRSLISKITFPSQLETSFEYGAMKYKNPEGTTSLIDVVVAVNRKYLDSVRATNYDYNASGDFHNYMGYPTYSTEANGDPLMVSGDNSYTYKTSIFDGVTKTAKTYNNLHLLIKTELHDCEGGAISKTETLYNGESDSDNYFPPYDQLIQSNPNYQYPRTKTTTFYNEEGDSREAKTTYEYNAAGQALNIQQYEFEDDLFQTTQKTIQTYDLNFGILLSKDIYDYSMESDGTDSLNIVRTLNTLSADGKQVLQTEVGTLDAGTFMPEKVTTYTYDDEGRVLTDQLAWSDPSDKEGIKETSFSYSYELNESGTTLTKTKLDAHGDESIETYDLCSSFLIAKMNALGSQILYEYDNLGRVKTRTNSLGISTTWTYDTANNCATRNYPNGYKKCSYFNGYAEKIKTADYPEIGGEERILSQSGYNTFGQLAFASGVLGDNLKITYKYDAAGQVTTKSDAIGNTTSYSYDRVQRLKTTFLNGSKVSAKYYNRQYKTLQQKRFNTIDENLEYEYANTYNGIGKLISSELGSTSSNEAMQQQMEYDIFNYPISKSLSGNDDVQANSEFVRDLLNNVLQTTISVSNGASVSNSQSATSVFNALGQLTSEITAMERQRSFSYDASGNITGLVDFSGNTVVKTYYPNNKIASSSYTESNGDKVCVSFLYDAKTDKLSSIDKSINSITEGIQTYEYTVDGLLSAITYPDGNSLNWTYDSNGYLITFVDACEIESLLNYDQYGRLETIRMPDINEGISIEYVGADSPVAVGKVASITYENGMSINYTYSGFDKIEIISILNDEGSSLITANYTYSEVFGNLIKMECSSEEDNSNALNYTKSYIYNGINKLVEERVENAEGGVLLTIDYTMDAADNVINKTVVNPESTTVYSYTYNGDNQLVEVVENDRNIKVSYDDNGNLVNDGIGNSYTYNAVNQMVGYTNEKGDIATYTYYATGLRATKQVNNDPVIKFYYDNAQNANVVNEIQAEANTSYLMMGSQRLVRYYSDTDVQYPEYICPGSKSVLLIVDKTQNISSTYQYTAYGECDNSSTDHTIRSNPFMYDSQYKDSESGLYYLRARYYSPGLMCFLSWDSISIFNHYAYCNGNPIRNSDPSGHSSFWQLAGMVLGTIALVAVSIAATVVTAGVAGPELAAADGAEIGGVAADVAATTAEATTTAGEATAEVASGATSEAADAASTETGFGALPDSQGVEDTNCVFQTMGEFLETSSSDAADEARMTEGVVENSDKVLTAFRNVGLTDSDSFSLETDDYDKAVQYMSQNEGGTNFAFGYQDANGEMGHFFTAESNGGTESGVSFYDPQNPGLWKSSDDMMDVEGRTYYILKIPIPSMVR